MECFLEWGEESFVKAVINMNGTLIIRLREFIENEMRSCSMDFGCITPVYVYRKWGGNASLEEIKEAMSEVRRMM